MKEVRELMVAWADVPTLTEAQKGLVISLRDFALINDFDTLRGFAMVLFEHFPHDLTHAIIKARAEGLGAKVN